MTRLEFFSKVIARLEELQAALNALRHTIKEEIQSEGTSQ